jgi:hypothetical protein
MSTNVIIDERAGTQSLPVLPTGEAIFAPKVGSQTASTGIFYRVFSFPMMLATALVGMVFVHARNFIVDPDLWWHIKVGETILSTHHWPTTDPYSFTVTGQPWLAYEWLGEILLGTAHSIGGVPALDLLLIVLGSAIMLALHALMTVRSGNSKAAFVGAAVLFFLASVSFSLRPQMLGYLFLILTLIALERFRQGKSAAIWLLPVIMLLWVNTHGSWIIGMGTIFVYWMSGLWKFQAGALQAAPWTEHERRTISFVFLLCTAVLPITPYGTRIAASPFEFAFSLPLNIKSIDEWQPMPFNMFGGKMFLVLLLAMILIQVVGQFKWRLEELALFLFGVMMACLHVRFLLVFVPFFAPVLASILARWVPRYEATKDKFALNIAVMFAICAAMVHYFPSRTKLAEDVRKTFPVGAVEYMRGHSVPDPIFNNYGFGGYLVLSVAPQRKVFIDGRGDVYERGGILADYLHISRLRPGALTVLDNYGVETCLIGRDEPLATTLLASPAWQKVYSDDVSTMFVRRIAR